MNKFAQALQETETVTTDHQQVIEQKLRFASIEEILESAGVFDDNDPLTILLRLEEEEDE